MKALRATAILLLSGAMLAGCAGPTPMVSLTSLGLPQGGKPLADVTIDTSPDGGIYQNPDPMTVVMITRAPGGALIKQSGSDARDWAALERYGDFTFVGIAVRNKGAAGSDPQLNAMQIAADYAPAGTSSGPLSHFYHPMFPLALLSLEPSDQNCTLHVDPGESQLAVLAYPPISATPSIVWGVFDVFAIRAPFGGGLPGATPDWRLTRCTPPQPPPT
ncbi:MAG TPA: hypothetical protein VI434_02495 [Candidatus Dormibacteraeota bacterium]